MYEFVLKLSKLPSQDKIKAAKQLDQEFMDPEKLEIFTEAEATYNAMLLKKRDQHK